MRRAIHATRKKQKGKKHKNKKVKNRKISFDSKHLLPNNVFNALTEAEKETFKKALSNNDITQVKSLKDKHLKAWKRNRPHDDPGKVINISKFTHINRPQWLNIDDVTDNDDQSKDDNIYIHVYV